MTISRSEPVTLVTLSAMLDILPSVLSLLTEGEKRWQLVD